MSLVSSQSTFVKGAAGGAPLRSRPTEGGANGRGAATAPASARAAHAEKHSCTERRTLEGGEAGDGEVAFSRGLQQRLVSGAAAASLLANVVVVPVALALDVGQAYVEQAQVETVQGRTTEVSEHC